MTVLLYLSFCIHKGSNKRYLCDLGPLDIHSNRHKTTRKINSKLFRLYLKYNVFKKSVKSHKYLCVETVNADKGHCMVSFYYEMTTVQ